ncbi:MAG TPA: glycosyltransferase family 2 protein [Usitatibacter sp.]|nr:glycosyltransferase family 2 protein [Usitatibacter sp.]
MAEQSRTHLVLIPSYNPGRVVYDTVRGAREHWNPVWVVVDGSTDGTAAGLTDLAATDPGLRVLVLARNGGKGAAVLHGIRAAQAEGYTHVLTMDSDGQHPVATIPEFMARSKDEPRAMVLGVPVFDASAPGLRVKGRRVSNGFAKLETAGAIGDSLFGFRVYPIADLAAVMRWQPWMRRFDFDPEAAVRLAWRGVRAVNVPAAVRYLKPEEGGISHFNYWRDNVLLTWMHSRLLLETPLRLLFRSIRRPRESPGR